MKHTRFLLVALVLSVGSARAQGLQNVWQVVNPSVQNGPLVFTTDDSGFICTPANLYVTSDGGQNFTARPMPAQVFNMDIKDMCWANSQDGYVLFLSSDGSSSTLAQTTDAGNTWSVYPSTSDVIFSISFTSPDTGYATGEYSPAGTGYFVAKTTNAGQSWAVVKSSTLSVGPILFKTSQAGMFVVFDASGVPQVSYTLDGLAHVDTTVTIPFTDQGQQTTFLDWNDDGSWIVQYQGIVQSSDSGKHWSTVLPDDESGSYGTISCACFHGYRGIAFGDNSKDFQSLDYGASWHAFTDTKVSGTSYTTFPVTAPIAYETCSMPSDTVAYMMGQNGNDIALLRVNVPSEAVAQLQTSVQEPLEVSQSGTRFEFSAAAEPTERTIAVYDVLGRKCAQLPLAAMSTRAMLPASSLQPGSYFARLGNSIAKFIVW